MPKITNHKVIGSLDLKGLESLLEDEYDFLDISEAEMGIDEERWEVCLGWRLTPSLTNGTTPTKTDLEVNHPSLLRTDRLRELPALFFWNYSNMHIVA